MKLYKIITIFVFLIPIDLLSINNMDSIYVNANNIKLDRVLFYGNNRFIWIEHKAMTNLDSVIMIHYGFYSKKNDSLMFYFSLDSIKDGQKVSRNKNLKEITPDYYIFNKKKDRIFQDVSLVYKKMFGEKMPNYTVFFVGIEFKASYSNREMLFKQNKSKYIFLNKDHPPR